MANFYDFSSDKNNIFEIVLDKSGSMHPDESNVRKGLKMLGKSFDNFPEANSIAVAISSFDNEFYPGEFTLVKEINDDYCTGGGTALYYSIVKSAKHLMEYVKDVSKRTRCIPRATFVFFSDGVPCNDRMDRESAKKAISELNYAGITTAFVAFGDAIESEFGIQLGFMSTINVNDKNTLVEFLGGELSKSCKEQSKSMKPLGVNFFSKAAGNSSGYSQGVKEVLEDDSWIIDDI